MKKNSGEFLVKHAHSRTEDVRKKLHDTMKTIEVEIQKNDGIYPFNGGRLSLSEVCRRAGVHKVTMQGPSHRDTSKPIVENWLKGFKGKLITGRKVVRRTVTSRADDWESKYRDIANKFNEMYAIEIIGRNEELATLRKRVAELETENLMLRADLSAGKVVRMPVDSNTELALKAVPDAHPRLILIRGLPGSGKSTLARKYNGYVHFEADMFFMRDGQYLFDAMLLPEAHAWCLEQARGALADGKNVVVSNVFATELEVKQYIDLGVTYKIVQANGNWRSHHQVSQETMERMRSEWVPQQKMVSVMAKYAELRPLSR